MASQRWNSSALKPGMAACRGIGAPVKRPVRSRMEDQKSTSLARWVSQSWMRLLKMGPSTSSRRTSA